MEPITKISHIPASRWALSCSLCKECTGTCIQVCGHFAPLLLHSLCENQLLALFTGPHGALHTATAEPRGQNPTGRHSPIPVPLGTGRRPESQGSPPRYRPEDSHFPQEQVSLGLIDILTALLTKLDLWEGQESNFLQLSY